MAEQEEGLVVYDWMAEQEEGLGICLHPQLLQFLAFCIFSCEHVGSHVVSPVLAVDFITEIVH